MGAWGTGVFENDAACDLASAVAEGGGIAAVAQALDKVIMAAGYDLEADKAEEGLAAAEIVARLRGGRSQQSAYEELIAPWIDAFQGPVPDELVQKAKRATARILLAPSELLELWADTDEFDSWKGSVEELMRRL